MYQPKPIYVDGINLPPELVKLSELLAENTHDVWAAGRIAEGWTWGESRDDAKKTTPCLVPYGDLPESEKEYDRNTAISVLKTVISLGWRIIAPAVEAECDWSKNTLAGAAFSFAKAAHAGQYDEDGRPFILHPIAVASRLSGDKEQAVAFLHDVLEDTDTPEPALRERFGDEITDAVIALTHRDGMSYEYYIHALADNSLAVTVKLADLDHNITRSTNLTEPWQQERLRRHKWAREYLLERATH